MQQMVKILKGPPPIAPRAVNKRRAADAPSAPLGQEGPWAGKGPSEPDEPEKTTKSPIVRQAGTRAVEEPRPARRGGRRKKDKESGK